MRQQPRNRIALAAMALAFPICALADLSQTKTLGANTNLNLETGATGSSSGGDLLWSGTALIPQDNARVALTGLSGSAAFDFLTQATVQAFSFSASSVAIASGSLPVGTVLAVFNNAGHAAKVIVTASSGTSITLQFTTYGAAGGSGGGPTITGVLNNSSDIPAGFPNSGIAQGSLFKVLGTGLANAGDASLHSSEGSGLQTTVNGASISVTVGSITKQAAIYYSTPTQLVGVLPSSTPTGAGTVTVTYNGVVSNAFTIQVVAAAPGITTYNGSGVAQHALTAQLVTYTNSAAHGEVLIIWGTGFGPTANSDTVYDTSANQTSVPYTIYIGGVPAEIAYKGASVYPGVGVFGVTVPPNAPTGCFVPFAAVANGNVVSNTVTLPIAAAGGVCSDPQLGYNGNQISTLNGTGTVKSGFLIVSQSTVQGSGTFNSALAIFDQTAGVSSDGETVSIGGCVIAQTTSGSPDTSTPLNAGTITVTGPGGTPVTLTANPFAPGLYSAQISSIPANGGAFVFNAAAGSQVGAFTATVNFPNPLLVWTNQSAAATVNRGQGLTVNWTGGGAGTYVSIAGGSSSGSANGNFTCIAPVAAGTFTVPSYILLGMPAGQGETTVSNTTNFSTFSAVGLDFGGAIGSVSFTVDSNFN